MYFPQLSSDSRVWVYQSNRPFSELEKQQLTESFKLFTDSWSAHGSKLAADACLIHDYFVVLTVDEKVASASGCSIDSSVNFIKKIGSEFSIDFFNRLKIVIEKEGEIKMIAFSELDQFLDWNVFDTLVATVNELNESFVVPVKESRFILS